jgi:hypothetical protein
MRVTRHCETAVVRAESVAAHNSISSDAGSAGGMLSVASEAKVGIGCGRLPATWRTRLCVRPAGANQPARPHRNLPSKGK